MSHRHVGLPKCHVTNKFTYSNEKDAHAEVKFIRKNSGARMHEYVCTYCGGWHVGHWRPKSRRKIQPWTDDQTKKRDIIGE